MDIEWKFNTLKQGMRLLDFDLAELTPGYVWWIEGNLKELRLNMNLWSKYSRQAPAYDVPELGILLGDYQVVKRLYEWILIYKNEVVPLKSYDKSLDEAYVRCEAYIYLKEEGKL